MARILVISGDNRSRRTWRRWLSDLPTSPFEVVEATNDEEVLARYEEQVPDGILLDAALPEEGAREVVQMLRDDPAAPPVVLLASPDHDVLVEALEAYVEDVLARDDLTVAQVQRVATHLARQRQLRQERDQAIRERQRLEDEVERMRQDREEFLAAKSHDLRSPLNAVIGYSELLLEKLAQGSSDDLTGDVEKIREVSRRLLGVVAQMTQEPAPDALKGAEPKPEGKPAASGSLTESLAAEPLREEAALPDAAGPILIIDDDGELRDLMARFLETEGYDVETTADGAAGLERARQLRPAAITLDLHMPGMDGWAVLKALKEDPDLMRTPVIMLTGRGNERVAARALRQGVDDYLIKGDISALTLRRAVKGVLEKSRLQREVEAAQQALVAANEALRQSERRYRLLAEHASDMISRHTLEGVYRYASPASQSLFGYEPEELIGRSAYEFFHPDDVAAMQQHLDATLKAGASGKGVSYRFHNKDGTYRWVETRSQVVRGAEEEEIIAVTRDVTERVEAEQALQAFAETLEQRVEEQTAKIRALASSLTLAEQRERQRIAHVLHDGVQQHLAGLNMRVKMLLRKVDAEEQPALHDALAQMARIVDEATAMTRTLSVELSPPALQDASLATVMEWLALHMKELHGLRVEVEAVGSCEIPHHEMRVLLFQLVRELLFNTVKHADVDWAQINLRRDDENLYIDVKDDGKGFEVKSLHRARRTRGGWGLSRMEERLSLFNSTLTIDSAPGQGTHITLSVPCSMLRSQALQSDLLAEVPEVQSVD